MVYSIVEFGVEGFWDTAKGETFMIAIDNVKKVINYEEYDMSLYDDRNKV